MWLHGPPISGKTQVVRSWLNALGLPFAWYQLDERDSDLGRLVEFMVAAIRAACGHDCGLPQGSLAGAWPGVDFGPYFAEQVLVKVPEHVPVLVFDDFHTLGTCPALAFFERLFRRHPDGMQIVVISREPVPSGFVELVMGGVITEIDPAVLRLDREETETLFLSGLADAKTVCADTLQQLHRISEGWIGGIAQLKLSYSAEAGSSQLLVAEPRLARFFDELLKRRLGEGGWQVLAPLALLDSFSASDAEALDCSVAAFRCCERMAQAHEFVQRLHGDPVVYRFHPLLHQHLRERFARYTPKSVQRRQCTAAAKLCAAQRQTPQALVLLAQAEAWLDYAELLEAAAPAWLEVGQLQTLVRSVSHMPDEISRSRPWLAYYLGLANLALRPTRSLKHLEAARRGFSCAPVNALGQAMTAAAAIPAIIAEGVDMRAIVPHLQILESWIVAAEQRPGQANELPAGVRTRIYAGATMACMFSCPEHGQRELWATRTLAAAQACAPGLDFLSAAAFLTFFHAWHGEYGRATHIFGLIEEYANEATADPFAQLCQLFAHCAQSYVSGRPARGLEACSAAHKLIDTHDLRLWRDELWALGCQMCMQLGDRNGTRAYLSTLAGTSRGGGPLAVASHAYHLACDHFFAGDLVAARSVAEDALRVSEELACALAELCCQILLVVVNCELLLVDGALAYLQAAEQLVERLRIPAALISLEFARARVYLVRHDASAAVEACRAAFRQMAHSGTWTCYLACTPTFGRLLDFALRHRADVPFVIQLIHRSQVPAPPQACGSWPRSIDVRCLGGFRIQVRGDCLGASLERKTVIRGLLSAMIAYGNRSVPATILAEAYWGQAGSSELTKLHVYVKRARELIGIPDAITHEGGKITLAARHWSVDLWDMEQELEQIEAAMLVPRADLNALLRQLMAAENRARPGLFVGELENQALAQARRRLEVQLERCRVGLERLRQSLSE